MLRKSGTRIYLALCFMMAAVAAPSQETVPDEILSFVPTGYMVLDYKTGDLDGDRLMDAILILKNPGEDSILDQELLRPFLILTREANGSLKKVLRNDSLVMCRQCGGVFGDPYADLEILDRGFTIHFYGGSSWRWGYSYRFDYKPAKKGWYLVKETQTSFQAGDPEATMEETEIGESELGAISAADFSTEMNIDDSNWKVIAAKTYFFQQPATGSKPRKAYLVKGNQVRVSRVLKNFVYATYENEKNVMTSGFLLKKDLLKIN